MSSQLTRQTGWACRIYKNSDDKALAIDNIVVTTDTRRITATRFHHSSYWSSDRMLINLGTGTRVIAKIQMLGDYDSITEDGGDYLSATWDGASTDENDVTMGFGTLPVVGDSL